MFSYHPAQPMYEKSRTVFVEGHQGRETGHASRHAFAPTNPSIPYALYRTKYTMETGYGFDYDKQKTTWFSGLPGLWVQDAACQSGVTPIYDRPQAHLCTSDTGISMPRRLLLAPVGASRSSQEKPKNTTEQDLLPVRAIPGNKPKK